MNEIELEHKYYKASLPLSHLLRSNDPPSDGELALLITLVRDLETESSSSFTGSNEDLSSQNESLNALHKSLKDAMSLIRQIPDEVLSEILVECLPTSYGRSWNRLSIEEAPWTLARVSRRWRTVALSDHRLWSSIDLDTWEDSARSDTPFTRLLHMSQSSQHLLAIKSWERPNLHLVQKLFPHSERWQFLSLRLRPKTPVYLEQIKGRLSELRELHIRPDRDHTRIASEVIPMHPCDAFGIAPKLREATIFFYADYSLKINRTQFALPWHQLTSLKSDSAVILGHCHQLVNCELEVPEGMSGIANLGHSITLPKLRNLSLQELRTLDILVLPSLESLSLSYSNSWLTPVEIENSVRSLVFRSRCMLKTLDLGGSYFQRKFDLGRLMMDCSDLLTLVIKQTSINFAFEMGNPPPDWRIDPGKSSRDLVTYRKVTSKI